MAEKTGRRVADRAEYPVTCNSIIDALYFRMIV